MRICSLSCHEQCIDPTRFHRSTIETQACKESDIFEMNPEFLACGTTNTQLEPIRRVIEASVPVTSNPIETSPRFEDTDLAFQTTYNKLGQYIRPVRTNTSLENPFLRLTQEEYRTLR